MLEYLLFTFTNRKEGNLYYRIIWFIDSVTDMPWHVPTINGLNTVGPRHGVAETNS